ncbi:MAG: phosphoribosylamine--glycine ligase [archaeon]
MKKTNILVVGSGGREHALACKLEKSDQVEKVFCAPGNGGTKNNVNIASSDFQGLASFAQHQHCFTVVGPEDPLAGGIVDVFHEQGLEIYGPTRQAARVESSKVWTKLFMKKYSIPTASFAVFDNAQKAMDYADCSNLPLVAKADGLAAGKGVIICKNAGEARKAIDSIMIEKKFGEAGRRIVLEEYLTGEEASYMAIIDSESGSCVSLASSQDHKPIFDKDKGPNTGGMGAYSPAPVVSPEIEKQVRQEVVSKFIQGMRAENITFKGTLYVGLMIAEGRLNVLEFNVRFGDPEFQPIMARMDSDLFPYLQTCVQGRLHEMEDPCWSRKTSVCVVMASGGYPGIYEKGKVIRGLDEAERMSDVLVFHAGTARIGGQVLTNGGRVLGITGLGEDIEAAIRRAYEAVGKISWEKEYHRNDIGAKALKHA